jgi:hypothetical protein
MGARRRGLPALARSAAACDLATLSDSLERVYVPAGATIADRQQTNQIYWALRPDTPLQVSKLKDNRCSLGVSVSAP